MVDLLRNPSCRLLTLAGLGGIGKTRLGLEAAAKMLDEFSNGAYLVSLSSTSSADFLLSTIADALKFSFYSQENPRVQLLNYLREKSMLLVLDSFEHLMAEVELLGDILQSAPGVKILVTSRERLNVREEWPFEVEGLPVPEQDDVEGAESYSAVQIFLHGARRISREFSLSGDETRAVIRICEQMKGMPLGIELASTWVRVLSCEEISREIEKSLDVLSTSSRDVPERHRSLRTALDYSWNLLSEEERGVFVRLVGVQR